MNPISDRFFAFIQMDPQSNLSWPAIQFSNVVFPHPLGPNKPYLQRQKN